MNTKTAAALPVDLGGGPFTITTRDLTKHFGSTTALNALDLRVPEGAVYVLVGPNGAGKTTLLRTLIGMARRDHGTVEVLGIDPERSGADARGLIGYVPEGHRIGYPWMTVGRLLKHCEALCPSWDTDYAARLVDAYEVDLSRKCRFLAKG